MLWMVEHKIRQGPDVPSGIETGEKGVKMIDFVGVPITVPHDGPHEGIVEIPWNHLKAPLLVLIQVVIVHVVPIVGVEVAHHCVHGKRPKHPVNVIGTRHGEKLFEVLLSREEISRARELKKYYSISPDLRDLNYEKFVEVGEKKISVSEEYNSHNTNHLNMKQTQKLLMQSSYIKKSIKGIYSQSED